MNPKRIDDELDKTIRSLLDETNGDWYDAFCLAAKKNYNRIITRMLEKRTQQFSSQKGCALLESIRRGNIQNVELLSKYIAVTQEMFDLAIKQNQSKIGLILLGQDFIPKLNSLQLAIDWEEHLIVDKLLRSKTINPNWPNFRVTDQMLCTAANYWNKQLLTILLTFFDKPIIKSDIILCAIKLINTEKNAGLNRIEMERNKFEGSFEVIQLLLKDGRCDPNETIKKVIELSETKKYYQTIELLLSDDRVNLNLLSKENKALGLSLRKLNVWDLKRLSYQSEKNINEFVGYDTGNFWNRFIVAVRVLRDNNLIDKNLSTIFKNDSFLDILIYSDHDLINLLNINDIPHMLGVTHIIASLIMAYIIGVEKSISKKLIIDLLPYYSANIFNDYLKSL